jgi:hypothetical protein
MCVTASLKWKRRNTIETGVNHADKQMRTHTAHQVKSIKNRAWLPILAGLAIVAASAASAADTDNRAPEVPQDIAVSTTNKVSFHGYAIGVQIYTWNGASWGVAAPRATLFDADGNIVATHFAGPTGPNWKSNSGSRVVGAVVPPRVIVDTNSIPWLLLSAIETEGPGILDHTTFIQRVNTVGGKAPFENGTVIGQVAEVPYTADYFFYRHSQQ